MKKHAIAAAAGLAVACIALYGAYHFGFTRGTQTAQPSSTPGAESSVLKAGAIDPKTGRRILYWHDPMVPGQRFDKPGKSPFMEMQLVPVYADGEGSGSGVTVDSHVAQNLGLRTAEAKPGRLAAMLQVPGNVAIDERSVQIIQARTNAFVQHVAVRATLDPVRRGQALVTLYSPDWVAAQEEYLAVSRMAGSEHLGDLRARGAGSHATGGHDAGPGQCGREIRQAAARGCHRQPGRWLVTEVAVREGMTVSPGMTLFRLADLSQVWVIAEVAASQAGTLRAGAAATVLQSGTASPVVGKVDAILPDVNPATRTVKARIVLPNPGRRCCRACLSQSASTVAHRRKRC